MYPRRLALVIAVLVCQGCVSPSAIFVNRQGNVIRCAHTGYGTGLVGAIAMSAALSAQSACERDAQLVGYLKIPPENYVGIKAVPGSKPILVDDVDGPALAAGIQKSDVITHFDGQTTPEMFDLIFRISKKSIGEKARITVQRAGSPVDFVATIAKYGEPFKPPPAESTNAVSITPARTGPPKSPVPGRDW